MLRRTSFRVAVCAAFAFGISFTAAAEPISTPNDLSPGFKIINFEDFDMEGRVTTPLPNPVTFGDLTFTSLTGTGPSIYDISIGGRGSPDGPVFNNTLFPGAEPDSAILIQFAEPVAEFLLGWGDPDFNGNVLRAFDVNGQLLEEGYPELGADAAWIGFKRPTADIARIIVQPDQSQPSGDDYEIDNIHYNITPAPPVSASVTIDVKPGSDPNCLNINGHGVIPVAVLGSAEFDVHTIDQTTLSFAGLEVRENEKGDLQCHLEDTNIDGYWDLICKFEDNATNWMPDSDTEATLTGNLLYGTAFQGTDSICLRPGKDEEELEEATDSEPAIKGKKITEDDNLDPRPWW